MTTRQSERLREMEERNFKSIIKELLIMLDIFKKPYNYSTKSKTYKAKRVRNIYISILKNIRLFHKYFPVEKLNNTFKILTTKGYKIIHDDTNSNNFRRIIEKPILDMVTYIYKYNQTISRVVYKLSNELNKDIGLTIDSYIR